MSAKPSVHGKNVPTGKGFAPKVPGNINSPGPSNHVPTIGKAQPVGAGYANDQQQQEKK